MQQMLATMREFLHNSPVDDRPYLRFYTLTHLYNQPRERVSDADMDLYRAGLSKAVNSLSWKPRLVLPQPIDPQKTIFAIDLRHLDWDRSDLWKFVLACYPYGLTYENSDGPYRAPYLELSDMAKSELPYVRGRLVCRQRNAAPACTTRCWNFPITVDALETKLGVNLVKNFHERPIGPVRVRAERSLTLSQPAGGASR